MIKLKNIVCPFKRNLFFNKLVRFGNYRNQMVRCNYTIWGTKFYYWLGAAFSVRFEKNLS